MIQSRRQFITRAAAMFCAPAIVRASSLMALPARPKVGHPIQFRWLHPLHATGGEGPTIFRSRFIAGIRGWSALARRHVHGLAQHAVY